MVVSDLHANQDRLPSKPNDTYILTEPPEARPLRNPLTDLKDWVADLGEKFDYLIVPGDIANQADGVGLAYAWDRLAELASLMGAELVGVPGNHDVITHTASSDPRSHLKALNPSFPTADAAINIDFWANGWAVLDSDPEVRIVLLDSTVGFPPFPAGVSKKSAAYKAYLRELDRGSFSEKIEDELEKILVSAPEKLNILVLHHHPVEHQNVSHMRDLYGAMHRGGDLVDLLSRHPSIGRWIIIHGHKHIPQLVNAVSVSSSGPLVLCAASLGHRLWHPINTVVRNQFHILDASNDPVPAVGSVRGEVHSFFWGYGIGWAPAESTGSGLPAQAGFGCVEDPKTLAKQIIDMMNDPAGVIDLLRASDLLARFPQLRYQLPSDASFLRTVLRANGFDLIEHRGRLTQLGRRV